MARVKTGSLEMVPVRSAGGVVYRTGRHGVEVVLCGRRSENLWALPKGTPEAGETADRAAAREVQEETGLRVKIENRIGSIHYQFVGSDGTRYDKTVEHYLMSPQGGSLSQHDGEFDDVRWFAAGEALRILSYPNERSVLRRALRIIESGGAR